MHWQGFGFRFKYVDATTLSTYMVNSMDVGVYFVTLQYILMGSVGIALALIFLHAYYGKEEDQTQE
jgi:hypothetical protein